MEPRLKWNKIILAAKIIMVAVWNRADHYIFNSSCGFFLFSSPDFSRRRLDVCRTTTHVVALVRIYNAMQVWNVLHAARWKCRMQKNRQKIAVWACTIGQLCRAISSQLRHISTIGKNELSSNISSTCPHNMVNFGVLAAEIVSLVWGTPGNFNSFRVLASLLQRRRLTETNQTLRGVWPSPGLVHYIHFGGFLPRYGILPGAEFTLHPPSLALSYFGSVTPISHHRLRPDKTVLSGRVGVGSVNRIRN